MNPISFTLTSVVGERRATMRWIACARPSQASLAVRTCEAHEAALATPAGVA
jgi:hypothetical protein